MTGDRDGPSRREIVAMAGGAATALGLGAGPASAAPDARRRTIMVIRHAEKPAEDGSPPPGLGADGRENKHALVLRGWQRAGALARFFAPRDGHVADAALLRPVALMAAAPSAEHKSERSVLTLGPLAALLDLRIDARFGPEDTAGAAAAARAAPGPVLIAWEHKRIARLVGAIADGAVEAPHWPGSRFDMVLVLVGEGGAWRLSQVPQMLLAGDSTEPLPPRGVGEAE